MTTDAPLYDVAIVGAGPGGSAAAIRLAELGWRVLLLEKYTFPRDKVCGDLLSPRSLQVLETLGCLPAIRRSAANQLRGGILYVNGERISEAKIPQIGDLPDYGYALPRLVFDEIVFRQAQKSGAETVEGCTVKAIEFDAGGVTLTATHRRKTRRFRARLVIGADGVHSIVARTLNMAPPDGRSVIVALRAYYEGVSGDPGQVDLFFDENFFPGYGWIFHLGGGRANIGLGMVRDVYQRYDINLRRAFDRWVVEDAHAHARLSNARLRGRIVGWPLNTYRRDSRNYAGRALLVGDAGSFVDPINGEGIHTALETAVIAAGVADEALRAGDLSAAFLSRYETRWRRALDLDLRTSDLIVSVIQNRPLIPLFMLLLRMIGRRASTDAAYAAACGGILAGVVPAHHSVTPGVWLKTLLQDGRFWQDALQLPVDAGVLDWLNSGVITSTALLESLRGMLREPRHSASWGFTVAAKGAGLLQNLGARYVVGTARYVLGHDLAGSTTSNYLLEKPNG